MISKNVDEIIAYIFFFCTFGGLKTANGLNGLMKRTEKLYIEMDKIP